MDPPYLQALKGEMPIMKMGWFKSYKANFIDAHRFRKNDEAAIGASSFPLCRSAPSRRTL